MMDSRPHTVATLCSNVDASLRHLKDLGNNNIGLKDYAFGSLKRASPLGRAISRKLREASRVLVVVRNEERAKELCAFLKQTADAAAKISTGAAIAVSLNDRDIVLAVADEVLTALNDVVLSPSEANLVVFDEAQFSSDIESSASLLAAEHLSKVGEECRPQILGVVTCDDDVDLASVTKHLNVIFPGSEKARTEWKFQSSRHNGDCTVEFLSYCGGTSAFGRGEATSDLARIRSEIGPLGVSAYHRWYLEKNLLQSTTIRQPKIWVPPCREARWLFGISEKTALLFSVIAKELKEDKEGLSVVVYTGEPLFAIVLCELMRFIPLFSSLCSRVLIGDRWLAQPVDSTGSELRIQDDELDDEAVDSFAMGSTSVLLVANNNAGRISSRFRIPPAPLVISFDGASAEELFDLGHDRECRKVILKQGSSFSNPKKRRGGSRKRRRSTSNALLEGSLQETDEQKSTTSPSGGKTHPEPDETLHESDDKKSPVSPNGIHSERGSPFGDGEVEPPKKKSRKKHREYKTLAPEFQKSAVALLGPKSSGSNECYLYSIELPSKKKTSDPFMKESRPNKSYFGVILSGRISEDDMELNLTNLGYNDTVDCVLPLKFIGRHSLGMDDVKLIRNYNISLFSNILDDVTKESFTWENPILTPEEMNEAGHTPDYLVNYLVVPLRSDAVQACIKSGDALGAINFGVMKVLDDGIGIGDMSSPMTIESMEHHIENLEGKLCRSTKHNRPVLAGYAQYDMCVLTKFDQSKNFKLNEDGSFVPTDDIRLLFNAVQVEDKYKRVPLYPDFPKKRRPGCIRPPQKFAPHRNRLKKRQHWTGEICTDFELNVKRSMNRDVDVLHQPPIVTVIPRRWEIQTLCDVLKGESLKSIACNWAQEQAGCRATSKHLSVPETIRIHPVFSTSVLLLPCILMNLERHVLFSELRQFLTKNNPVSVSMRLLVTSVTPSHINVKDNFERLELLGDAVLQLTSTVRIYTDLPHVTEGHMHNHRKSLVCNYALKKKAECTEMIKFFNFNKHKLDEWTPPGTRKQGTAITLNEKSTADVTEALCGAMYLGGYEEALAASPEKYKSDSRILSPIAVLKGYGVGGKFLDDLNVFRKPDGSISECEPSQDRVLQSTLKTLLGQKYRGELCFPKDERVKRCWESHGKYVQQILKYKFKHRELLFLACTHKSYVHNGPSDLLRTYDKAFQRLEFLGDAIVGLFISAHLYHRLPGYGPGALTDLKGLCVSNENFARVVIKFGLEKYYFIETPNLREEISRFKKAIDPKLAQSLDCDADEVGAPKALGDLLESLVGAVFVDRGLRPAWNVCMHLLKETIDDKGDPTRTFENPSSERLLRFTRSTLRLKDANIIKKTGREGAFYKTTITLLGEEIGVGRGSKKALSLANAYENALANLENAKQGSEMEAKIIRMQERHADGMKTKEND